MNKNHKFFSDIYDCDQNISQRKMQILRSTADLIERYPGQIPSVNAVIKEAKIARSTFYAYFTDKNELYQEIIDIFSMAAHQYLVKEINGEILVESLITWFDICQANRELYISLSRMEDRRFPTAIRHIWEQHLEMMLNKDNIKRNEFRVIHMEYIPRSNVNITYAWLTLPHMQEISSKTLAQFINLQRLNYYPKFIADSNKPKIPPSRESLRFVASEVVSTGKVRELIRIGGEEYLHANFTDHEILQAEMSKISIMYYARFWVAKRVICKCINHYTDESIFPYISITIKEEDQAEAALIGPAMSLAQERNINHIILSVAYESEYATAYAIATS